MPRLTLSPAIPPISLPQTPVQRPSTGTTNTDWSDFIKGTAHVGQGRSETLVHSLTDRNLSIRRFENGVIEMDLKRPPIDRLVLSGGGAKGVAFSGMVKALEESQTIGTLRILSGSSAGAISAAFLASGMTYADFDKMSDETNLVSLLDSQSKVLGPIQHASSTVGRGIVKIPGKVGSIGRLLCDLMPRLQSKASPLEALIHEKMVESVLSRANQALNDRQPLSQASRTCLENMKTNGYVTFGDLATLSKDLPEIKQLHITGTAMFDGRPQMVVFNASLTPDMDVARAAHISGSLPVVFAKPSEQQLPFQVDGEHTSFQDGGIMLNTPIMDLYEPQFAMSAIPDSEQLILKFQSGGAGKKKDHGTLLSAVADKFIGAPYSARHAHQTDAIKGFADSIVTVRLKTERGNFTGTLQGTVNFNMATELKNHLQEELHIDVQRYLERHEDSETYRFSSIGGALLALDDSMFAAAADELLDDPESAAVIEFRQHAQQALENLKQALTDATATTKEGSLALDAPTRDAMRTLDQLGDAPGKIDWLARKLNHGNDPAYMLLLQTIKRLDAGATGPKSMVLSAAIKEMGVRDIVTKSENFIREVIYPSLYRLDQPNSNVKLLNGAIADLREAQDSHGFNAVLRRIADQYVSRTFPSSSLPFNSTTVDQARAWLIPGV
ncbi:patatin-like phospholipase family protein [Pseudomonas sp. S2_E01]